MYIEKQSSITLFYANRNEDSVIFEDELNKITLSHPEKLKLISVFDTPKNVLNELYTGRVTKEKAVFLLSTHLEINSVSEFFICGPGPMMENIKEALNELKVAKEKN